MELSAHQSDFSARGYNVASITYEPPEVTQEFSREFSIQFPILYDQDAHLVQAFGVINPDYAQGHSAWGIPLPGVFLLDPDGRVLAKFYRDGYKVRPEWQEILSSLPD